MKPNSNEDKGSSHEDIVKRLETPAVFTSVHTQPCQCSPIQVHSTFTTLSWSWRQSTSLPSH